MDALVQVIEDWEKQETKRKQHTPYFLIFAKAFDLVDHKILLTKIDKMLPSWLTSWIAQYLRGRKQRVKCNKHSEWLNVIAGVTQGSVLGPALFLLFISDMNEYLPTTAELIKYADDLLTSTNRGLHTRMEKNKIKCDLISTKPNI
jgi:ribonuclease P/MRP protein subunit RPP40